MFSTLRAHLAWKVFLSYVVVILVGVVVLTSATSLSVPAAYTRHMAGMSAMMSRNMMGSARSMEMDLFSNYQTAVREALSMSALAALVAAVIASFLISRQVVGPVQKMTAISHRIADGEYSERLKISNDIHLEQLDELDQLAISFNQMAEKLEKTETMRRQLIGDVTHELRTPLAAIKGYMEGLIDGVLPATPETYDLVYSEADRLQRLANDLQELSRAESGAYPLEIKPHSIIDLIQNVVSHLERQYEAKGVQLITNLDPGLPDILVDKDRILQVLFNLIGNALQYTSSDGKVMISAQKNKKEIIVSIEDTGLGISADHIPNVFKRFYRVDKSRSRASGGSGIGLTIAQAIITAHHGRIWVESPGEGKGSTFHFTVPVA